MTRTQYAIIATVIANLDVGKRTHKVIVDAFVNMCMAQNPYFKESVFREWCSTGGE